MSSAETGSTRTSRLAHHPLTRIVVGAVVCVGASVLTSLLLRPVLAPAGDWGRVLRWLLSTAALLAAYAGLYSRYEQRRVTELGRAGAVRESLLGLAGGAALVSLTVAILALLDVYAVVAVRGAGVALLGLLFCIATAALEEILFRGILFRIAETWLGTHLAVVVSAVPFGLVHLRNEGANGWSVASAVAGGVLMAMVFVLGRRLWLPIFFHAGWNWALLAWGLTVSGIVDLPGFVESRMNGPELLTGGAFGPENSLIAIGVVVLAAAGAYLYAWRSARILPRPRRA